jgi:hypothetical protein
VARCQLTEATLAGACRLLQAAGMSVLTEVPLKNRRRADILALARDGGVVIVEVKSSREDFLADLKWREYLEWCDLFYFAVPSGFDEAVLPAEEGLIVADRWEGVIVREAPRRPLAAARRRSLLLQFAHLAAARLQRQAEQNRRLRLAGGLADAAG